MASPAAVPRLFPVGHCIGAYYDDPGSTSHTFRVRLGPDVIRLSSEQFAVWGLAHGVPDRPPDQPWDRHSVVAAGYAAGLRDPERAVADLTSQNALVEAVAGADSGFHFARQHRMLPLMLGLGNTADEPRVYAAGVIGQPIVLMSSTVYDLFAWAHLDTDLWSACQRAAESAIQVQVNDVAATDPARLLDVLLGSLHTLLSPNAVCLDTRFVA